MTASQPLGNGSRQARHETGWEAKIVMLEEARARGRRKGRKRREANVMVCGGVKERCGIKGPVGEDLDVRVIAAPRPAR